LCRSRHEQRIRRCYNRGEAPDSDFTPGVGVFSPLLSGGEGWAGTGPIGKPAGGTRGCRQRKESGGSHGSSGGGRGREAWVTSRPRCSPHMEEAPGEGLDGEQNGNQEGNGGANICGPWTPGALRVARSLPATWNSGANGVVPLVNENGLGSECACTNCSPAVSIPTHSRRGVVYDPRETRATSPQPTTGPA
jgi:hypothetical protein